MASGFTEPDVTDDTSVFGEYSCINCMSFWVLYFIDTTLLVMIHIPYTQKWAAECNPPLQMTQAFVANIDV